MTQSLASIKIHLIFSTKSRLPFLIKEIRPAFFAYLVTIAENQSCRVYEIGGVDDHVHILLTLPRTMPLSKLVELMKTSSSKWLKTQTKNLNIFSWQHGYGAFSVSQSQVDSVRRYIRNQEAHHARASFQDEFRAFLKSSDIEYDEKYLWD